MSQPTSNDVHVDAILTNISVAYIQEQSAYIASQVFPIIPVEKQSDKYFTYAKGDWFRDEAQLRAPATESAGSGTRLQLQVTTLRSMPSTRMLMTKFVRTLTLR